MAETTKYLYGAAVQGIQNFIFKTNRLKEIVGASELVERICTDQFIELRWRNMLPEEEEEKSEFIKNKLESDENIISAAAGNVKYLFDNEVDCRNVVLNFPKRIMEYAPGISISQAVVKIPSKSIDGKDDIKSLLDALPELEKRLKVQRNKPVEDIEKGLLVTTRSRRTGSPAVESKDYNDKASLIKQNAVKRKPGETNESSRSTLANKLLKDVVDKELAEIHDLYTNEEGKKIFFNYETDKLTQDDERSYIAVIHADGNNLGKIIQQLSNDFKNKKDEQVKLAYRNFSLAIDEATREAAQQAFYETFDKIVWESIITSHKPTVPFRPIILSGDDLTVLCEAKYAVKFTEIFLKTFEIKSKEKITKYLSGEHLKQNRFSLTIDKLTACAGIAFIKNKFPFYYAVELAETLCGEAKRVSKEKLAKSNEAIENEQDKIKDVPSSLLFFKVESTFFRSYNEIKTRVLTKSGVDFCYGPYFTGDSSDKNEFKQEPKLETLISQATLLKKPEAPASQLRKWLNILHKDKNEANTLMTRTIQVLNNKKSKKSPDYVAELGLSEIKEKDKTHIYDLVSLTSLTKECKEE